MTMTPEQAAFWAAWKATGTAPADADARFHSAFAVGSGSDAGADLVIGGVKTATSSLPSEFGNQPPPGPGDLSILLGGGRPRAVIETLSLQPLSLNRMPPDFIAAYAEWPDPMSFRAGMLQWYQSLDPAFSADTPLLCERFRVVWAP